MKDKKLTKLTVDKAVCTNASQIIIWDSELKGFGLRVTPTRKTYVVQSRIAGKSIRVTIGLHGPYTPDAARNEAKRLLVEMAQGVNPNDAARNAKIKGVTFSEAYADYLKCRSLTANTIRDYDKAMRLGFSDWGNKPIQDLNRALIEQKFDEASLRSKAQANQMFRFLRSLLNFAMEKYATLDGEPLIPSNPCDRLKALKKWHNIPKRTRYIPQYKLKPWFEALKPQESDTPHLCTIKDYCAFVLLCGCRNQEAASITWENVDLINATVTFIDTKNHTPLTLPIGVWLNKLLIKRKNNNPDPKYVFPASNSTGHLMNHSKCIKELSTQSGVPFTPHDLRRSFISIVDHQLTQTFSGYTIKKLLNHKGNDVTAGYIQFGIEDLRKPMQLLETFVLTSAGILPGTPISGLDGLTANDLVYLTEDQGV